MLTFLTLFLGLASGPQPVAVSVTPPVVQVHILLDGEVVATLDEAPWRTEVDLGDALRPHRLEAVGYNAAAEEVSRVGQTINVSLRQAKAALALEPGEEGRPPMATLAWQSAEHPEPARVDIRLDGEPLEAQNPRRFPLPPFDPSVPHVLSAELVFPDATTARADLALGAGAAAILHAQNTALALDLAEVRALRADSPPGDLVHAGETPVEILAMEGGAADIVVVPERSARDELVGLRSEIESLSAYEPSHVSVGLNAQDRMFLVSSLPERTREGERGLLFRAAPGRSANRGGLIWQLSHIRFPQDKQRQRLADTVAIAGMLAASGGRPRTVLLLLGPDPEDHSEYSPAEVRRFLEHLRVPLVVWRLERDLALLPPHKRPKTARRRAEQQERVAATIAPWGPFQPMGSPAALFQGARDLRHHLGKQRIAWVKGEYLPNELTLDPDRADVRLAGTYPWPASGDRSAQAPTLIDSRTPTASTPREDLQADRIVPPTPEPPAPASATDSAVDTANLEPEPLDGRAPPETAEAGDPAERGTADSPFQDQLDVSLIELEVVVTDRRGRRLQGLPREEFEVLIDGRPAEIVGFSEAGEGSVAAPETATPSLPPTHIAVWFDQVSLDAVSRARVMEAIGPFLDGRLAAGDQLALMSWNGSLQILTPFTQDAAAVRQGIETLTSTGGGSLQRAYNTSSELRRALTTLEDTVHGLAGIEGGKMLLYIGGGIPFVPAGGYLQAAIFQPTGVGVPHNTAVSAYLSNDLADRFEALTRTANRAGVTIHTLDAHGVRDPRSFGPEGGTGRGNTAIDARRDQSLTAPLRMLAHETGGRAMVGTNDLSGALAETDEDLTSHYALSLRTPPGFDGRENSSIEVRLDRSNAVARHRRTFRPRDLDERMTAATLAALLFQPTLDQLGAEVEVGIGEATADGTLRVPLIIALPLDRLTLLPGSGEQVGTTVALWIVSQGKNKHRSAVRRTTTDIEVPAAAVAEGAPRGTYRLATALEVEPGDYDIAIGVRDMTGSTASVLVTRLVTD